MCKRSEDVYLKYLLSGLKVTGDFGVFALISWCDFFFFFKEMFRIRLQNLTSHMLQSTRREYSLWTKSSAAYQSNLSLRLHKPMNLAIKDSCIPLIRGRQITGSFCISLSGPIGQKQFPFTPSQVGNDPVIQKQTGCKLIKKKKKIS